MQAVQIPALGDQFMVQAPQPVPEERLPALEVVVTFQELCEPTNVPIKPRPHQPTSLNRKLSLCHQIRIKSAEFWLMLGEADEAMRELEPLPGRAWNHPSAKKVRVAALKILGERTGPIVEWRKRP
jgi:hypothetical protein